MQAELKGFNRLIREMASKPVVECWNALGHALLSHSQAKALALYVLDLATSDYRLVFGTNKSFMQNLSEDELSNLSELYIDEFKDIAVRKCFKGQNLIGFALILEGNGTEEADQSYVGLINFIYNRAQKAAFVENVNKPISANISANEYSGELKKLAERCCNTQFGVFRKLEGSNLTGVFSWGFDIDLEDEGSLWASTLEENEDFLQAFKTKLPQPCVRLEASNPEFYKSRPIIHDVVSYCALPVLVGNEVEGILSVGLSKEYYFSEAETELFLCVANGVGVALSNYRLHWESRRKAADFEKISSSIVGVEVAQSIRHSILGAAGNIKNGVRQALANLPEFSNSSARKVQSFQDRMGIVVRQASEVQKLVAQMKDVMQVDRVVRVTNIKEIWKEATSHLEYYLSDQNIQVSEVKGLQKVPMLDDMVKHIFHNLLINSIDAFSTSNKGGRKIDLRILDFDTKNRVIRMRYSDNGAGLNVARLQEQQKQAVADGKERAGSVGINELIFLKDVSTKKNGSGYGLFLCRKMAEYHGGSVSYASPENGVGAAFYIDISYDLNLVQSKLEAPMFAVNKKGILEEINVDKYVAQLRH